MTENWHTWYFGGVDSESRLRFSKFRLQSCPFCLKIGAQSISRMLIPNQDLDVWNSDLKLHFWANLEPKIQSCPFCLKIGAQNIARMLIPNPDLDVWNFDPKIHFWANLGPKSQSCLYCLKIGTHGISRILILIPTLVSSISNPNFLLLKFVPKKSKMSVLIENWYTWYLGNADSESRRRFLKFRPQNPFLGKFGTKRSKVSVFPEHWHAWHLDDADSYSNISFLNYRP